MAAFSISHDAIVRGDQRALARLISMIEMEDAARVETLGALHRHGGHAHMIGITGPPGAGKSTLTDKMVGVLRSQQRRVAVLAVDPSSPFTGGAILGDRIRMQRHATDPGVFIRSLATRGHLGGLSRAVSESTRALDAAGYDDIIIETVGVGQSEVDIVRVADTVVLVSVPGLGDDIQAIKAGVMEIGDVFCVNKADQDGAERVSREIKAMLETAVMNGAVTRFSALFSAVDSLEPATAEALHVAMPEEHPVLPGHPCMRIPPVVPTTGETGEGVPELVAEIQNHHAALVATGFLRLRRQANMEWELGRAAADRVMTRLEQAGRKSSLAELAGKVIDRTVNFHDALDTLEDALAGLR